MPVKRNVLLISADHTRNDALACNAAWAPPSGLAHVVQTPNLDRLAGEGVTFANAFTPDPICVPARASITTGSYPHVCTGVKANHGRIRGDQVKLGELFAQNGYVTYAIGKLHYVPYAPPGSPRLLHGFQHVELNEEGRILGAFDPRGELEGLEDYHGYLKGVGWGGYERAHGVGNNDVRATASLVPAEHHEEAWVASRTIAALEQHRRQQLERPFLAWASFAKPHSPCDPPHPYDRMYDPRQIPEPMGGWDDAGLLQGRDPELIARRGVFGWDLLSLRAVQAARERYAGMVSFQDAMIGRILAWLRQAGLMEETIIVYTSDHGDLLGDFGRFLKTCMFDGAVRIPMLWRVPGVAGRDGDHVREQMSGLQDILPTLCSLTGVTLPREVDGMDLAPILADADAEGREVMVVQTEAGCGTQKSMLRTREWKYVYGEAGGTEELYDARRADGELENLAGDPAWRAVKAQLRARLVRWCLEHGDEAMLEDGELRAAPEAVGPAEISVSRLGWRRC